MAIRYQYTAYPDSERATSLSNFGTRISMIFGGACGFGLLCCSVWTILMAKNMFLDKGISDYFKSVLYTTLFYIGTYFFMFILPTIVDKKCKLMAAEDSQNKNDNELSPYNRKLSPEQRYELKQEYIKKLSEYDKKLSQEMKSHIIETVIPAIIIYLVLLVAITALIGLIVGIYLLATRGFVVKALLYSIIGFVVLLTLVIVWIILVKNKTDNML